MFTTVFYLYNITDSFHIHFNSLLREILRNIAYYITKIGSCSRKTKIILITTSSTSKSSIW
ncbi:hypothetical protein C0J52_08158 [Blattella germanica]|nr:hypothetical protein C0J52_08158 [Blattella germanica]